MIVVLGMHRSGTSAIMKAIESLGVSIGDSLMPEAEGNNSKGFFEDIDIYRLNEEMLSTLNTTWYDLSMISKGDVAYLNSKGFLEKALKLLSKKLEKCDIFGFKEPRTTKLVLFWQNVFAHIDCRVDYVLALRHPQAVAMSLKKRDGIDTFRGQLLWLSYQVAALTALNKESWIIQFYDSLISSPESQLQRLSQSLLLELNAVEAKLYSDEFIDPKLRNFTIGEAKNKFDNEFSLPLIEDIFNTLLKLKDNDLSSTKLNTSDSINSWLNEFNRLKGQIDYINSQLGHINYMHSRIIEKESQLSRLAEIQNKNLPVEETSAIELSAYYGVSDATGTTYSEEFSSKHFLAFSDGIKTLKFKPDQNHDGHISSIRFDTANTPCLAYLFEFSIKSNIGGKILWSWNAGSQQLPWDSLSGGELIDFLPFNELNAAVVICTNDDPQMIFDISNLIPKIPKLLEIYLEVKVKLLPIKQGAEAAFNALTKINGTLINQLTSELNKNRDALKSTAELRDLILGNKDLINNFRSEITDVINNKMELQEKKFKNEIQTLEEKLKNTKNQLEEATVALRHKTHQLEQIKKSRMMRTALLFSKMKNLD